MVNLNLISKDKFKEMGFKNKSRAIAFIKTSLQTKVTKFKTAEQLAHHIKPKINNMVNLGIDINAKENSTIHKTLKQLKQLNTKKGQAKEQAITNMLNKLEKQINTKTWNITGKIKIKVIYNVSESHKRPREYIYYQEEIDSIIFTGTKDDSIEEFKRQMFEKYERIDPSPDIEYKVEEITITSITEHSNTTTQQADMPMKNARQLMSNYIDEYKDYLQDTGTCVVDNFIGMYGEELKLTRDTFIVLCREYNNQNWTPDDGVSPRCVNSICEKYDIAHYAFDVNKACFIQNISKKRNHKALIYFPVNNHMYLILDQEMRNSLVAQVKVKENFNTSLLSNDDHEKDNIFDTYDIVVNPKTFTEKKDTIYMYSRQDTTNINDIFHKLVQDHGVPKDVRCKKLELKVSSM